MTTNCPNCFEQKVKFQMTNLHEKGQKRNFSQNLQPLLYKLKSRTRFQSEKFACPLCRKDFHIIN